MNEDFFFTVEPEDVEQPTGEVRPPPPAPPPPPPPPKVADVALCGLSVEDDDVAAASPTD